MRRRTKLLIVALVIGIGFILWVILALNCPDAGIGLTRRARHLHYLKNRIKLPEAADFDPGVTFDALLESGDDSDRWLNERAARIQGQVLDVAYSRMEATNCYNPCRRDIHIVIANRKEAPKNEQVIVEVTPNLDDWATQQGHDWSEKTLQARLVGHWCEFEGWLYFDVGHAEEAENTAPGNAENWRATAWELHPVTKITVIR